MMADEQHEVQEMGEGNIVVAVGLKHVCKELRVALYGYYICL